MSLIELIMVNKDEYII